MARRPSLALVLVGLLSVSAAAAVTAASPAEIKTPWHPNAEDLHAWMSAHGQDVSGQEGTRELLEKIFAAGSSWVSAELAEYGVSTDDLTMQLLQEGVTQDAAAERNDAPYWNFFPQFLNSAIPDAGDPGTSPS